MKVRAHHRARRPTCSPLEERPEPVPGPGDRCVSRVGRPRSTGRTCCRFAASTPPRRTCRRTCRAWSTRARWRPWATARAGSARRPGDGAGGRRRAGRSRSSRTSARPCRCPRACPSRTRRRCRRRTSPRTTRWCSRAGCAPTSGRWFTRGRAASARRHVSSRRRGRPCRGATRTPGKRERSPALGAEHPVCASRRPLSLRRCGRRRRAEARRSGSSWWRGLRWERSSWRWPWWPAMLVGLLGGSEASLDWSLLLRHRPPLRAP